MPRKPTLIATDLEGVLVPEIWIAVAEKTGIERLRLTTRDIPDYDQLMLGRIAILREQKLKLADIVINLTAGGPGGATDTVTSFIFREYRDRSNVGYGTLLAMVYLVVIVIFMTVLMKVSERFTRLRT